MDTALQPRFEETQESMQTMRVILYPSMNRSTIDPSAVGLLHMIRRVRLGTASQVEAKRLRDHHA